MNEPTPATIVDKTTKPAGLLPKNVQSWLIFGVAVLMVLIMWLTGGKRDPGSKLSSVVPTGTATGDVNETKVAELQNRIQQLQRDQLIAQNALAQQTRLLGAASSGNEDHSSSPSDPARADDAISAERKKRGYLSLFASNVALSYRKAIPAPTPSGEPRPNNEASLNPAAEPTKAPAFADLVKQIQAGYPALPTATANPVLGATATSPATEPNKKDVEPPAAALAAATSATARKTYILFEGTIFETVLLNRLDGGHSGPIECLVSNDVFSRDRQHLLVPAGSKVLGETRRVELLGQTRLAVLFHRLLMPDGYSVSLDQFKGLNQAGDTGLRDRVNNHYLTIFGASLALGAIGAVTEAGTGGILTESGTDRMREGFAATTGQSSAQILDRFLNIPPTITIREGHRVKVYLAGDLTLPDYHDHRLPSDL